MVFSIKMPPKKTIIVVLLSCSSRCITRSRETEQVRFVSLFSVFRLKCKTSACRAGFRQGGLRVKAHHLLSPSANGCHVGEEIFNAWSHASTFSGPDVICPLSAAHCPQQSPCGSGDIHRQVGTVHLSQY